MTTSIHQYRTDDTSILDNALMEFYQDPTKFAEFTQAVEGYFLDMARNYLRETFRNCEETILESPYRRAHWEVVKTDAREILTCLGPVSFDHRLYRNKQSGESCYLMDRLMGLDPHEKIAEDACVRILEEAVQTSYRRGGSNASLTAGVSKNTVKRIIHGLKFPSEKSIEAPETKKKVDYLYIDADEDHIALQFQKEKGDLETNEQGMKLNNAITKLIYVYEGIEPESPKSQRKRLVNPHYFSGTAEGAKNRDFWDEVYAYITREYDVDSLKKIYLNSDGGIWIRTGKDRIAVLTHVLDEFHLNKYMRKMTGFLRDSSDDVMEEIKQSIIDNRKEQFHRIVKKLLEHAETPGEEEKIRTGGNYILENWDAAVLRLVNRDIIYGCSAEGHVSHVLSSRMSSRPMGWSRKGADNVSQLRAYFYNKGSMLKLIRDSKRALPMAAGAETDQIFSSHEMIKWEQKARKQNGKYYEALRASISSQNAKKIYLSAGIWGL